MYRLLPILLLFACDDLVPNDNQQIPSEEEQLSFSVSMLNERGYPMFVDGDGYTITISPNHQSIFKMKGITKSNMTERITWSKNQSYSWSNGIVVDDYWLVNPTSFTKDSVGYSMVGFMPEMKNSSVVIYGHYYSLTDSIVIHIQ